MGETSYKGGFHRSGQSVRSIAVRICHQDNPINEPSTKGDGASTALVQFDVTESIFGPILMKSFISFALKMGKICKRASE